MRPFNKIKRWLMLRLGKRILVILLLMGLLVTNVYAFEDVKDTDWFYKDVTVLQSKGIITGYSDNTFRPHTNVSNIEALALILRTTGYEVTNVPDSHWGTGYLFTALVHNILDTNADFMFDEPITRGEVADYVVRALILQDINIDTETEPFLDTSSKNALILRELGIINGVKEEEGYYYKPEALITRAELGAVIKRVGVYIGSIVEEEQEEVIVEEEQEEIIVEEEVLKLLPPLKPEEYTIPQNLTTVGDFEKLLVYIGYNNKSSHEVILEELTYEDITTPEFKNNIMSKAFTNVFTKYPEYFSVSNNISYTQKYTGGVVSIEVNPKNPNITDDKLLYYRGEFLKSVDKVLEDLIAKGELHIDMTQKEIARYLFDWVVQNTRYDYNYSLEGYMGYGQIKNGLAVCQGYTSTYNYMLKRLGIEAYGISGVAGDINGEKENHIWTIAYLDGERYHIDSTWGDSYDTNTGNTNFNYFAIKGTDLKDTHIWDKEVFGD